MPSSITLTVSHLATSTSFFLSALQPLKYGYRGRSEQTVGFGPLHSSAPADFWLTQECPGVPAGAAHVAFPAPTREAVQDFFHAALKAGATIHGEPCVRDAHGYYSAAVIDFDGNSIEAVYRPGFDEESKENYVSTAISKRSSSRAPTNVSRASSSTSKALSIAPTMVSKVRTAAPSVVAAEHPKPQGDALETLLNQARSTADVARKLVEQVRPHFPTTSSTPAAPKERIHNPDAFAKPGDGGNAVIGTLLGVAAGAALTYAFTHSRKGSPDGSDDSHVQKARRPSLAGRSATTPPHQFPHYQHSGTYRALEAPHSHHVNLQDNDYASTIRPARRRGSVDSGLGISPPSTSSRSCKRGGPRMLEAPPTSYKAPTVITQAQTAVTAHTTHSRNARSKTRQPAGEATPSRSSSKHRRSRSESRSRHIRHDSGVSTGGTSGYETVLHVTTQQSYGPSAARGGDDNNNNPHNDHSPPSAKWTAHKMYPLPNESVSSMRPAASSKTKDQRQHSGDVSSGGKKRSSSRTGSRVSTAVHRPAQTSSAEGYPPLPPSRAATWTAGGPGSSSHEKAESFVSARSGGRRGVVSSGTKTVIGKMRDIAGLKVRGGEVRPEDSVSQVG